ncbi:hypothetical protein HAX54_009234 [Datura stramonium]|uniref:Uncharacterized protein n=1 Tax=Datura stramonium TaxID=4076 RepID=A0ABS8RJ00_DATST|nr:hypothetical protein [Datura stramonium]
MKETKCECLSQQEFPDSKKTGVALLKNIKGVANSMSGSKADREFELPAPVEQKQNKNSSQWIKNSAARKINKEFTALQLCQEIEAHEGSIWTVGQRRRTVSSNCREDRSNSCMGSARL